MVESLVNVSKMPAKKMDFVISSVLAFKRRSVARRGEVRKQINGAAVQGQMESQIDPFFICLLV